MGIDQHGKQSKEEEHHYLIYRVLLYFKRKKKMGHGQDYNINLDKRSSIMGLFHYRYHMSIKKYINNFFFYFSLDSRFSRVKLFCYSNYYQKKIFFYFSSFYMIHTINIIIIIIKIKKESRIYIK